MTAWATVRPALPIAREHRPQRRVEAPDRVQITNRRRFLPVDTNRAATRAPRESPHRGSRFGGHFTANDYSGKPTGAVIVC